MSLDFISMRAAMIASQLRPNMVDDAGLLAAFAGVPREDFVPASLRAVAYADVVLDLGDGRRMNSPMVTGRLLDALALDLTDRLLVVADPTGYTAALARLLCGSVTTATAEEALEEGAEVDAILIDGAVEQVPDALAARLAPAGRLACGLVEGSTIRLALGRHGGNGLGFTRFGEADMPVLPAFARPRLFVFE